MDINLESAGKILTQMPHQHFTAWWPFYHKDNILTFQAEAVAYFSFEMLRKEKVSNL